MMVPFLFTMGLCALSNTIKAQTLQLTDLLPAEERVQIKQLANGVKTYIQEHHIPAHCGSFRVVLRNGSSEEELYRYDGTVESLHAIEEFFNYCKEKVSSGSSEGQFSLDAFHFARSALPTLGTCQPHDIAVIAVGDFPTPEMHHLIEKHFGGLELAHQNRIFDEPIKIGIDPKMSKVAITLSYPTMSHSVQTYSDLKETWKALLLQDLFQQRLEQCSRGLEKVWVHPHPRFFYPVKGYSLVQNEDCENLLTFFLWQVEAIRNDGFFEDEFYTAKRKLLNQLQYLASRSATPDDAFLASYFADQFLLGDRCLSLPSFMHASAQLVEEIHIQDLFPQIDSFLFEKNRSITVAYPPSLQANLTKDRIEQIIDRISSLASFYHDSEISEDEMWTFEKERTPSLPVCLTASQKNDPPRIKLANDIESEGFQLAKNHVIPVDHLEDSTTHFYQLPLTEKEKRLIHVIITTMAEKNILQLAFIKRSLEKKGKKIEHVHPMRFMGYILSSSQLRSCLRSIKKSSFKWDAFIGGFSRRMKEEHSNNNLHVHIPGFCQQIGGDPEVVTRFIQKKDWEGLVREHI